jgi:hypothetical protein
LTAADDDREEPEVELIDEVVLHQGAIELAGTELQDVLAGLLLQGSDFPGDVPRITVEFHAASLRVVEATYFGRLLILSEKSSPLLDGQAWANPS